MEKKGKNLGHLEVDLIMLVNSLKHSCERVNDRNSISIKDFKQMNKDVEESPREFAFLDLF